jgi:hypothetical protein
MDAHLNKKAKKEENKTEEEKKKIEEEENEGPMVSREIDNIQNTTKINPQA